jgi:exopolysaccharide biosynthesis polyprenyl glycosylphosphotransferase
MDLSDLKKKPPILGKQKISDILRGVIFCGDSLFFVLVLVFIFWIRLQTHFFDWLLPESSFLETGRGGVALYWRHLVIGTALFLAIGTSCGIYSKKAYLRPRLIIADIFKTISVWFCLFLLISFFFEIEPSISRSFVILSGITVFIVLVGWRESFNWWIAKTGLVCLVQERILVVGWNQETQDLWKRFGMGDLREMSLQGVLHPHDGQFQLTPPQGLPILGGVEDLGQILHTRNYDALMLSDTHMPAEKLSEVVQICHRELVRFMVIPAFFEVLVSGLHIESIRGVPVLAIGRLPLDRFFGRLTKRGIDLLGGGLGLMVSMPFILLFAILVKIESPGPAFYNQVRVGRRGTLFQIIKMRSMKADAEEETGPQWASENDGRRLRIGAFMRKWNIDELPQFWNVLKGEMSLVGPRPERPEFTKEFKYSVDYYNVRHTVRPGLTGWAAVNGWRGDTDLKERIRYDLDYIERWSVLFDFYIMLLTFLRNKNAY